MTVCSMPKNIEPFLFLDQRELDYINSQNSLTKKLCIMTNMLSLTKDEHAEREKIVNDIFHFLRPYYPECDILVFGSSANGFGFTGCDLDLLFLPFQEYCNLDFKGKGSGVVPSPSQVLHDPKSRSKLYEMDEEMHLKFVQRIMFTVKQYFKKVTYIPARCPILDISFHYSDVHCDFSTSNRLVLYNTQLMWVYGKLDTRVTPLVMFLRFWAKSLGFVSKSLLSSYCMTLLVIFFLQNIQPAVLPSVRHLKDIAGYSRIIDGWETAICNIPECINNNRYENSQSVGELLINFFDFYWIFDFVQQIVSVHDGRPLPVDFVKTSEDERIKSFQVTPWSVQDPFILCRNVSRNSTMKTAFKLSLMVAKKLVSKSDFRLQNLFDSTYYQHEINNMFQSTKQSLPPPPTFLTFQLTYELHCKLEIMFDLKPWYDKVSQCVVDILRHGLLFECDVIDKVIAEPPTKKRKFKRDNIGNLKLMTSIQCVVNFPTVGQINRADVLKHLQKTDVEFEAEDNGLEIPAALMTEYQISKFLCKDDIKDVTKLPEMSPPPYFSFICDCFRYPEDQLSDIVISFSPLTKDKYFRKHKEFVKSFVRKHMMSLLEEC